MDAEHASAAGISNLEARRDQVLIRKIARGNDSGLADLLRSYGPPALGLATRLLGDASLAEDVLQDVYLSIWRHPDSYDAARGSVRTWLLTQVHHRAVDIVRREEAERRRRSMPERPTDTSDDVVEDSWRAARASATRDALASLPAEQQQMITLAYYEGLTQTQISARAGIPLGTVKSRTLTAMRRLRHALSTEIEES
jgi:RNA polymerase sigma factor (sigma-70 family)